ncbi:MAG: hypothetical protein WD689_10260 [Gaiellaceae bacterium]
MNRRRLLELAFALLLIRAAPLQATPAIADDEPTPPVSEGPFFTPRSPRRRSIVPAGAPGTRLTLSGRVLTTAGKPVPGALVDFWQADARGTYDNDGYRFRGHQLTDSRGRYTLHTVVPGLYPGRTRHIHVKVQRPRGRVLTTQLFFPGVRANASDGLYLRELLVDGWRLVNGKRVARFDFVL